MRRWSPHHVGPSMPICRVSSFEFWFAVCSCERAEGFRHLGYKDDHQQIAAEWIVYDALYAYCQEMVKRGRPSGAFMDTA